MVVVFFAQLTDFLSAWSLRVQMAACAQMLLKSKGWMQWSLVNPGENRVSCIDFSVSQTSSDDLVLNFFLFSCCYHFFVSPSLSIPSGFFQTVLVKRLSTAFMLADRCPLTGVRRCCCTITAKWYLGIKRSRWHLGVEFWMGIWYSPRAASQILLREESLTQECVFGWYKSTCGVFEWTIFSPTVKDC